MSGKSIATVYFYLISAVAIGLMVTGVFNGVSFVLNSTQYDEYPLRYGPARDCEMFGYPYPAKIVLPGDLRESTPSADEIKKQKELCQEQLELERKQHRVDDIKNAITFTSIGIVLFLIHFPQAKKYSKD